MYINLFWLYGFRLCDLGEHKYAKEKFMSEFFFNGKVYPSVALAKNDIYHVCKKGIFLDYIDGEELIGLKIDGHKGINYPPDNLDSLKQELIQILERELILIPGDIRLYNPKLFFIVNVDE